MANGNGDDKKLVPDPGEMTPEERWRAMRMGAGAAPRIPAARQPMPEPPELMAQPIEYTPPRQVREPGVGMTPEEHEAQRYEELWQKTHPEKKTGWGRFGQIMGTIGQDVGEAVAPGVMERIPGTNAYNRAALSNMTKLLAEDETRKAETGLKGAEAEEARQRGGLAGVETEKTRAQIGRPTQVTGERGFRTDEKGNSFQQWIWPDGWTQWEPADREGAAPTRRSEGENTLPTTGAAPPIPGALPSIQQGPPMPGPGAPPPMGAPMPTATAPQQPRYTYGVPAKPTAEEQQRNMVLSIAAKPENQRTPQEQDYFNKNSARYEKDIPLTAQAADSWNARIASAARDHRVDPGPYQVREGSSLADAKANLSAIAGAVKELAPTESQERKDARTMGYALNPQNQLMYTNRKQAEDWGSVFEEMKPADVKADRQAIRQLDDIQKNISAYDAAILAIPASGLEHYKAMQRIEADTNPSDVEKMGYLTLGAAMDMIEKSEVANSWNKLDKNELAAMIGYLRAKGAMIAYNRIISGTAKSNREALIIDWQNLPHPYVGARVAVPQMQAMQQNLDLLSQGFPVNLPAMQLPEEVQKKTEQGAAPATPPKAPGTQWNPVKGVYE